MLTVQECQKNADELEQAALRMHLRSHREAYTVVAEEWRRLGAAVTARSPLPADALAERIAALGEAAGQALDSPLRRSILKVQHGWELMEVVPDQPI